jgi:hypothetical protein
VNELPTGVIRKGLDTLDRERCPSFSPSLQVSVRSFAQPV